LIIAADRAVRRGQVDASGAAGSGSPDRHDVVEIRVEPLSASINRSWRRLIRCPHGIASPATRLVCHSQQIAYAGTVEEEEPCYHPCLLG
jgi:hypothetical protein